jgi:predicted nucleic acid-binding protein
LSLVLDNSVALSWCFEDEQTAASLVVLDRVVVEGALVPWLWPLEALNGLLTAERRNRLNREQRHHLVTFLRDLPITLDPDGTDHIWTDTAQLAERFRLTFYDATYLGLAQRRSLPLATRDVDLQAAAQMLGITLLAV